MGVEETRKMAAAHMSAMDAAHKAKLANVLELAKARSAAAEQVSRLGQVNSYGLSNEERVAQDARMRLAWSAVTRAEADYSEAIKELTAEELLALSRQA